MKKLSSFSEFLNESEESSLENYKKLIQKHDWYYEMSDDDRWYQSGLKEVSKLKQAYASLDSAEKESAYQVYCELYKKHYPESKYLPDFENFKGV